MAKEKTSTRSYKKSTENHTEKLRIVNKFIFNKNKTESNLFLGIPYLKKEESQSDCSVCCTHTNRGVCVWKIPGSLTTKVCNIKP